MFIISLILQRIIITVFASLQVLEEVGSFCIDTENTPLFDVSLCVALISLPLRGAIFFPATADSYAAKSMGSSGKQMFLEGNSKI
jgi:hypothetical protein